MNNIMELIKVYAYNVLLQCAAESVRGKKDWLNGVLGSVAGGAILGMRSRLILLFGCWYCIVYILLLVDV